MLNSRIRLTCIIISFINIVYYNNINLEEFRGSMGMFLYPSLRKPLNRLSIKLISVDVSAISILPSLENHPD